MRKEQNMNSVATDAAMLVLVNEMRRMDNAAERVRLVVKAMALKQGVRYEPLED